MIIVLMNGGLGNQLYQYAFIRCLELVTGVKCVVDDSAFFRGAKTEHNGYELEKIFGIHLNLLSSFFSGDVWQQMVALQEKGQSIPQQLKDNGLDIVMYVESGDYSYDGEVIRMDSFGDQKSTLAALKSDERDLYCYGYWVDPFYANVIAETLRDELVFPDLKLSLDKDTINYRYAEAMLGTNSVAVHIRRGDFVDYGLCADPAYFKKLIRKTTAEVKNPVFFVFSDDIEWCKNNECELGLVELNQDQVVFVQGNTKNGKNYIDMQLMGMCSALIQHRSSFAHWAYRLALRQDIRLISE